MRSWGVSIPCAVALLGTLLRLHIPWLISALLLIIRRLLPMLRSLRPLIRDFLCRGDELELIVGSLPLIFRLIAPSIRMVFSGKGSIRLIDELFICRRRYTEYLECLFV